MRVTLASTTLLGGAAAPSFADFVSPDDALEALPALAGRQAKAACDAYASAVRLQVRWAVGGAIRPWEGCSCCTCWQSHRL